MPWRLLSAKEFGEQSPSQPYYYVYQRTYQSGRGWTGWNKLGPGWSNGISGPAATSWGSNRVDLVVAGPQSVLWHKAFG